SVLRLVTPRPPSSPLFPYRRSSDLQSASADRKVRFLHPASIPSRAGVSPLEGRDAPKRGPSMTRRALVRHWQRENVPSWNRERVDRKSTRLNSSHVKISYAVFCLKK